MIKGLWSIAWRDLLLWCRMPTAIASAVIPPLGMALFLVVLSLAVTQQPVALVVHEHGKHADHMAEIIQSDDDAYLLTTTNAQTARRMLFDQEVAAVITVPEDFDRKIEARQMAHVELLLNNVDIDFADDIRRSVDRSVARFHAPKPAGAAAQKRPAGARRSEAQETPEEEEEERLGRTFRQGNPYLINIEEQDLRQTNVPWLNYQVIPVLVLLVLSVGLVGTALLCAQDIERKTAKYLVVTPQKSWVLVGGRLLGGFLASMCALVPAVALCVVSRTISPPLAHWPALAAVFAATALFASGLGAILGTLMSGARTIAMSASVTATYLFFLGGGFTTIAFLPEWLQTLSAFVPTRYAIDGMRQALFYKTLDGIPCDLMILCTSALVACVLGSLSVRRAWLN
jgi:ABC-2 type transport system permease protein